MHSEADMLRRGFMAAGLQFREVFPESVIWPPNGLLEALPGVCRIGPRVWDDARTAFWWSVVCGCYAHFSKHPGDWEHYQNEAAHCFLIDFRNGWLDEGVDLLSDDWPAWFMKVMHNCTWAEEVDPDELAEELPEILEQVADEIPLGDIVAILPRTYRVQFLDAVLQMGVPQ